MGQGGSGDGIGPVIAPSSGHFGEGAASGVPGRDAGTGRAILASDRLVVNSVRMDIDARSGARALLRRGLAAVLGMALLAGGAAATAAPVERLRVPPGFRIEVLTDAVPNARALTLGRFDGDRGVVYVGSMRAGAVYAVEIERGRARAVHRIATGLSLPAGVAWRDGSLYVSALSRILRFDAIDGRLADPPPPSVVTDRLPGETHHGAKYIAFGPDGLLYIAVGAPCNVCVPDARHGVLQRMKPDGSGLEVVASGVRNSVGFDWNPADGSLWFTDNGRDMLGDDLPGDELNRLPAPGAHFGFPYCHQGDTPDPEFGRQRPCSEFVPPMARLGAHVAALGMRFYTGRSFPEAYRRQHLRGRARLLEPQPQVGLPRRSRRPRCRREGRAPGALRRRLARGRRIRARDGLGSPGRRAGAARRLAADQRRQRRSDLPRLPPERELRAEQVSRPSATVPAPPWGDRV